MRTCSGWLTRGYRSGISSPNRVCCLGLQVVVRIAGSSRNSSDQLYRARIQLCISEALHFSLLFADDGVSSGWKVPKCEGGMTETTPEKIQENGPGGPIFSDVQELSPRPRQHALVGTSTGLERHKFDRWMDWLSQVTTWVGVAGLACFAYLAVRALAGQQTMALFQTMFAATADRWILGIVAALTSIGFVRERRLRLRQERATRDGHGEDDRIGGGRS